MSFDLRLSLFISFLLTFPLAFIQISTDSKVYRIKVLFTAQLWLYLFISCLGNVLTTLLAASILDHNLSNSSNRTANLQILEGPLWIWYTTLGVFGFQAMLKQLNISLYGRGVLSIEDWAKKSKNAAVAASLQRAAELEILETQKYGEKLYVKLKDSLSHIHTLANTNMGSAGYNKTIRELSGKDKVNIELYLCYTLATKFPAIVKGVLSGK